MPIVIVSGAIANKPFNGGAAWTRLNYILGFQKLGFDTYFIEQISAESCVDEAGNPARFEESANLAYFRRVMQDFGMNGRAALICGEHCPREWEDLAASAALLVNISGHLKIEPLKRRIAVKVYIDLDPGFTQIWHTAGTSAVDGHDCYFTVGENIGKPGCSIPTNGITWRPTRQPVVLEHWPVCPEGDRHRFTSIASWRGPFGPVEHGGKTLGSKVRQFRKYATVPSQTSETFELALDIHAADYQDREMLRRNYWKVVNPREVAAEPASFRRYVQGSGAEFSAAQEIYVETRSGWFSDRTVRYLASGKPSLVEDTGFRYPAGEGLLAFSSTEHAIEGVRAIARDYGSHARAARQIAETYFDSNQVLSELVSQVKV